MKRMTNKLFVLTGLFVLTLFVSGCATGPISPGTEVNTTSEVFKQAAERIQKDCGKFANGCKCTMERIETSCALVFACIDAGYCRRLSSRLYPNY